MTGCEFAVAGDDSEARMHTRASLTAFCVALGCLGILAPHASRRPRRDARAPRLGPPADAGGLTIAGARIVRTALTPAEARQPWFFRLPADARLRRPPGAGRLRLAGPRLRDGVGLLPLRADYDRVGAWLDAQGFERTLADAST